ncbi:MAG: barstar family protein [Clostridia bacterium]|nr:barstar family protein [Clostridia bacterium]
MKKAVFDFSQFTDRRAAHGAMRAALGEYGYEGNNLDALYDALTSMGDAEITLINTKKGRTLIDDYAEKILRTLIDAAEDSGCVTLIIK